MKINFAVVTPLANESRNFNRFTGYLSKALKEIGSGKVYLVVDKASKDNTLDLCKKLSKNNKHFITVWSPENKNVVDAYIRGYKEALKYKHEYIIEMDGGLSHNPKDLPKFIRALDKYECAFGSRFVEGGSHDKSSLKRLILSKGGTILANLLLGTKMHDMTSGFQGFRAPVVKEFTKYSLLSTAHFYQTELRYLLRKKTYTEVPINYHTTTSSISNKAIKNSVEVLLHYFKLRLINHAPSL